MYGAEIKVTHIPASLPTLKFESVEPYLSEIIEREKQRGNRPYVMPIGGSLVEASLQKPLGAIGYVLAFADLFQQLQDQHIAIDKIIVATGSGSTQTGLIVGAKILAPHVSILGISVSANREDMAASIKTLAEQTIQHLGFSIEITDEDIVVLDDYIQDGYGVMNQALANTLYETATQECVMLDPVYTGKAMMGLTDLATKDFLKKDESVLFLHTGGLPALFSYKDIVPQIAHT